MLFPAAKLRAGDQVSRVFAPEDAITHLFTRELLEDGYRKTSRLFRMLRNSKSELVNQNCVEDVMKQIDVANLRTDCASP